MAVQSCGKTQWQAKPPAPPPGYGYDLWVVYPIGIGVVALLYPLCLWYTRI